MPRRPSGAVETVEVPGSAELLDGTSIHARIPGAAVDTAVAWLDAWAPAASGPVVPPVLDEVLDVDGRVSERIVRLGPDELFAVETVSSAQHHDAPLVVLHNGAAEHRVGATDYQVDLARALARDGARVVRVDRRATGESSTVRDDERSFLFAQEWVEDQSAVVAAPRHPVGPAGARRHVRRRLARRSRPSTRHPRLVVEISPNDYRRQPGRPRQLRGRRAGDRRPLARSPVGPPAVQRRRAEGPARVDRPAGPRRRRRRATSDRSWSTAPTSS